MCITHIYIYKIDPPNCKFIRFFPPRHPSAAEPPASSRVSLYFLRQVESFPSFHASSNSAFELVHFYSSLSFSQRGGMFRRSTCQRSLSLFLSILCLFSTFIIAHPLLIFSKLGASVRLVPTFISPTPATPPFVSASLYHGSNEPT